MKKVILFRAVFYLLIFWTLHVSANDICTTNCAVQCPLPSQLTCRTIMSPLGPRGFILKSNEGPGDWNGASHFYNPLGGNGCPSSFTFQSSTETTGSNGNITCGYTYSYGGIPPTYTVHITSALSGTYGCNGNGHTCTGNIQDSPCTLSNSSSSEINFSYSDKCNLR